MECCNCGNKNKLVLVACTMANCGHDTCTGCKAESGKCMHCEAQRYYRRRRDAKRSV